MKKSSRVFTSLALALTLTLALLFTGCQSAGTESTPSSQSEASTTEGASSVPEDTSSTPESDTPSSESTPSGENLLAFAIADNEELLGGDTWTAIDGKWAGPLQEGRDGAESYAQQAFVEV